jgi:hypothetical protein
MPAERSERAELLTPELRAMLENFVSSSNDIAYATLLNADAKGVSAGRIEPDAFLQRELERAYQAAREGRVYSGQPLMVGSGKSARTVMLVSSPIMYGGRFLGMIGSVVDHGLPDPPAAASQSDGLDALRCGQPGKAGGGRRRRNMPPGRI